MKTPVDHGTPSRVLEFWFSDEVEPKWFFGGAAFDAQIAERFSQTHERAALGGLDHWADTVEGRLALILVLDQFSRNLHRDRAEGYASDDKALRLANTALRLGDDLWLKVNRPASWRSFLYMPFMHSENLSDQRRCIDLFLTHGPAESIAFARAHHDIIARFGRFPHRNAVLGRDTTQEEAVFLSRNGSGFHA